MKKFLTFILVLAMVMSVSSFAMAAACPNGNTCTVHGAAIGNEHYDSLEDALSAATGAGDVTITLLKDGSINVSDAYIKLGGDDTTSITIDGKGTYDLLLTTTYWSRLNMKKSDGKLILKNIPEMTSSQTSGTWNSYDVTFLCDVEIENVGFKKAVALEKGAKLTNVTIEETHDYYALWIVANGQTVELNDVIIESNGRGIKIDDQYVDSPEKVTLIVNDGSIESANKAAIMVKSEAGADVTIDGLDISNVKADTEAAVWVDEDAAGTVNEVMTNASKRVEGQVVVIPPMGIIESGVVVSPAELKFGTKEAGYSGVDPLKITVENVTENPTITFPAGDESKYSYTVEAVTGETNKYTITINPVNGLGAGNHDTVITVHANGPVDSPAKRELTVKAFFTVTAPTSSTPSSTGSGISVKYNGGNSFSTSNPSVPTGVEIDGVPVTFNGTGSNFSVGCISSDAKWVTVRWNSTSVTTNFTPDGLVECSVSIPKTGDMSIWAAIAEFLGF